MGNKVQKTRLASRSKMLSILILDLSISTLASLVAVLCVRWLGDPFGSLQHFVYIWVPFAAVSALVGFFALRSYRIVLLHSSYRSIGRILSATVVKESILALLIAFKLFNLSAMNIEFLVLMFDCLFTIFLLIFVRVMIIWVYDVMQDSPEANINRLFVLVYGTSNKSISMVTRFRTSPHYKIVGFLTPYKDRAGMKYQSLTAYSFDEESDLLRLKQQLGLDGILFTRERDTSVERERVISSCVKLGIHVMMAPEVEELEIVDPEREARVDYETISVTPLAVSPDSGGSKGKLIAPGDPAFIPDGMTSFERNTKRFFDFCIATGCIIVFSPLFLIVWASIKLEDGGPALYKQERIGRFGRPFNIYKFRSMKLDAEAAGPALFAGDDDPRLTKVGKFIRAHHLDELPQLFNVWCGDMAFVGPRPERKFYIDKIMAKDSRYAYLYQIRPGVTSYATYYNGYTDTIEKMLRRLQYDLFYLKHRSWWFDMKVLWMTFRSIIGGKKF